MAERSHEQHTPESPEDDGPSNNPRQQRLDKFNRARNKDLIPRDSPSNSTPPREGPQSPSHEMIARVRSVANRMRHRRASESPIDNQSKLQPSPPERKNGSENEAELRKQLAELQRQLADARSRIPEEHSQPPIASPPSNSENQPLEPTNPEQRHTPTTRSENRHRTKDGNAPPSEEMAPEDRLDAAAEPADGRKKLKQTSARLSQSNEVLDHERPERHSDHRATIRDKARATQPKRSPRAKHAGANADERARPALSAGPASPTAAPNQVVRNDRSGRETPRHVVNHGYANQLAPPEPGPARGRHANPAHTWSQEDVDGYGYAEGPVPQWSPPERHAQFRSPQPPSPGYQPQRRHVQRASPLNKDFLDKRGRPKIPAIPVQRSDSQRNFDSTTTPPQANRYLRARAEEPPSPTSPDTGQWTSDTSQRRLN